MVDFTPRVQAVLDYIRDEYGVGDPAPVEILLGAMLPVPAYDPPEIMLETDWYDQDCSGSWFALGGMIVPHATAILRLPGPYRHPMRRMNEWMQADIDADRPQVHVESTWEYPVRWPQKPRQVAEAHMQKVLRMRVKHPKMLKLDGVNRSGTLAQLVRSTVTSSVRSTHMPHWRKLPDGYAYWCELAHKLVRPFPPVAWEWLAKAIVEVAMRRALLYGREYVEQSDWDLAGRVLAWQVPVWVTGVLQHIYTVRDNGRISAATMRSPAWVQAVGPELHRMALAVDEARAGAVARRELKRLTDIGALRYTRRWEGRAPAWVPPEKDTRARILRLVQGKAFI